MKRRHRWRLIAQFDITPDDARRLTAGEVDRRPDTELRGGEHPPVDDDRPFFGLHNLIREEMVVACIDCEMAYTDAAEALECPGDPDSYGPHGEPLWGGKPLAGVGDAHRSEGNVTAGIGPAPGRNDPCWCGSGKKFKKCHGA